MIVTEETMVRALDGVRRKLRTAEVIASIVDLARSMPDSDEVDDILASDAFPAIASAISGVFLTLLVEELGLDLLRYVEAMNGSYS